MRALLLTLCAVFGMAAVAGPALSAPKKKGAKSAGKFIKKDELKGFFKTKTKKGTKNALKKAGDAFGKKNKKRLKKADKHFGKFINKKAIKRSGKKGMKKQKSIFKKKVRKRISSTHASVLP